MSFLNLLKLDYWFHQPYIAHGWTLRFWVIFFLFLILAGIFLKLWQTRREENSIKAVLNRWANSGLAGGLLGLLWMFFRQERVAFLAWRFWLPLIILIPVWTTVRNLYFLLRRYPKIKNALQEKAIKEKYLPGK